MVEPFYVMKNNDFPVFSGKFLQCFVDFERKSSGYTRTPEWFGVIDGWKKQYPFSYEDRKGYIAPQAVIPALWEVKMDRSPEVKSSVSVWPTL